MFKTATTTIAFALTATTALATDITWWHGMGLSLIHI